MKTPDWFEPRRKQPSKEQKEARKALKEADARVAMAEHEKAAEAFAKNRERLKAERLQRAENQRRIMPPRADHIPVHRERRILQMLRDRGELTETQLHPGPVTIQKMVAKGWVEAVGPAKYRITSAGISAMKAKI